MRWERQIWTLRSKIWDRKVPKSVLMSKNGLSRGFPRPKLLLNIFWIIPGSFRPDFTQFSFNFKGNSMKIEENQEQSDFDRNSPLLGAPIASNMPSLLSPLGRLGLQFCLGSWHP